MKTKPVTALQIRNGQLVVGGFFIAYSGLSYELANGQQAMITNPRFFHNGDLVDPSQPLDIDMGSLYQREVTLMYNLEANQFRDSTFLEEWRGPAIPNKAQIDPGLREATYRALHPETWYPHSRGTVGRKPVLEGQQPVKDVVVIGGGGGFRRGEFPLVSASTREGQSFNLFPRVGLSRVIGRPINNGLSSQDLADWTAPIPGRYIDFSGILGEPTSKVMSHQYQRLKALAEKNEFRAAKHVHIPGKHY